ncbi:serine hydrolase domain-containing protein [Brumimicrobium aurantiacum]|uniref:Class C beta-lactamase-related serine hydrolase n=1 Tax=Brumimicrobium aurantiacum TaxID=1737063 RepID=A0A3E1F1C2_9FLAO|nr:serine hydrolase [Brumimicrobium aurantiacum]RFC55543.1 class C beta-lactamase-related serine hydrolase [Brumimicrobium aurantiacum]
MKKMKIPLIVVSLIIVAGIFLIPKLKQYIAFNEVLDMENIEYSFINMDEYFPSKTVVKSDQPFVFPQIENIDLPKHFTHDDIQYSTDKYLDSSTTQGLLVIQNDTIQYENYWRGQKEDVRHISWSMSKSYISALLGIAMEEGFIQSIDQTVEEYLPELKGSGYEGVKIKDVLEMSTGIGFDETYSDPNSDINRYWKGFVYGASQDEFASTLVNEKTPGTFNHYVSINTHVLGMIIVKATGKSLTEYLEEKIWKPIGAEFDAYWIADGEGMEMALGGLNACLRDYAKLGRLYLNKGNWKGKQIVPQAWVEASTSSTEEHLQAHSKNSSSPGMGYGYQWWIPDGEEGEIMAIGVFNQHIYINPTSNTVIVKNSANKNYYAKGNPYASSLTHLELYREITQFK